MKLNVWLNAIFAVNVNAGSKLSIYLLSVTSKVRTANCAQHNKLFRENVLTIS